MFHDYENRFEAFYKNTNIPILLISGSLDELFYVKELEEVYNLIENKNKEFMSLEGETHTSILWNSGSHINIWLENHLKVK